LRMSASGSVKLSFMWLDAQREAVFAKALGIEASPKGILEYVVVYICIHT